MTFTIQQMIIAGLVLVGSTLLAYQRIINPDAVIALYSAVLGAVLNSTVSKAQQTVPPATP